MRIIQFVAASAATGAMTVIVTRSYLFRSLRWFMLLNEHWFGRVLCCPLCFSTWLSLAWTATMFQVWGFDVPGVPDLWGFLVTWFAMVTAAAPVTALVYHCHWSMPSQEIKAYEMLIDEQHVDNYKVK